MKRINQKTLRLNQLAGGFIVCAVVAVGHLSAMASTIQFYDWTSAFVSSSAGYTFNNTSAAGTISGSSLGASFGGGIASDPGTWGVPTAITPLQSSPQFTNEFQDSGQIVPSTATFNFSSGYNWGSGGELLIGNIHDYFQYTLSAWTGINETGTPINVNTWGIGTEYPSTAVGTAGYFSTSNTQEQPADANGAFDAVGVSENFYVIDNTAMANFGQGGVLTVGANSTVVAPTAPMTGVGSIELTLTNSNLGANAQQSDFFLFNVGTPVNVPEPTTFALCGVGFFFMGLRRRRTR